ncbi:MAG: cardiolipin synthase [Flavobacteriales bacterium]|nr:cardiolipin synthase [Flavobacteriales bacterium]
MNPSLINTLTISFTVLTIIISIMIVLENRGPSRTVAWLLVLILLPVVGIFFYLLIGQNHRRKKTFIKKRKQDYRLLRRLLMEQLSFTRNIDIFKQNPDIRGKLIPLLIHNTKSPITVNNSCRVLNDGDETFAEMLKAIEEAQDHIHMEYFIIKESDIGTQFKEALIKKAKEGIEIRLIYDAVGSWRLKDSFLEPLRSAGVKVKSFLPVRLPLTGHRLNYRNHRKILIIDGKVGFLGGLNIGDEYLGKNEVLGFWRDLHLRIKGEALYVLQAIFLMDWFFVSKEEIDDARYFPQQGYCGEQLIQIASSGPDSFWESIHQAYFTAITSAKNYVYIMSPYLVPDESILMALKTAAISGVDVRILLPNRPDHYTVFWASRSHFMELLQAGVKIYEYQKGFVHGKMILVDDQMTTIGTANLDIRSFQLNFEVNAFIYDKDLCLEVKESFMKDLSDSKQVNRHDYRKRKLLHRVKESLARIFSPVL